MRVLAVLTIVLLAGCTSPEGEGAGLPTASATQPPVTSAPTATAATAAPSRPAGDEDAAIGARSQPGRVLEINLSKQGPRGPYQFLNASAPDFAKVEVNAVACGAGDDPGTPGAEPADTGVTLPARWASGGLVRIDGGAAGASGCAAGLDAGEQVSVEVWAAHALAYESVFEVQP